MSKCAKLTPREVLEVEDWATGDLVHNNETDGYALLTPEIWLRRK